MSPEIEATPFVECCFGAVVVLAFFLAWLCLHREEPTQRERDDDLREAGDEWVGGDR